MAEQERRPREGAVRGAGITEVNYVPSSHLDGGGRMKGEEREGFV